MESPCPGVALPACRSERPRASTTAARPLRCRRHPPRDRGAAQRVPNRRRHRRPSPTPRRRSRASSRTPRHFMSMVRAGYQPVYRPARSRVPRPRPAWRVAGPSGSWSSGPMAYRWWPSTSWKSSPTAAGGSTAACSSARRAHHLIRRHRPLPGALARSGARRCATVARASAPASTRPWRTRPRRSRTWRGTPNRRLADHEPPVVIRRHRRAPARRIPRPPPHRRASGRSSSRRWPCRAGASARRSGSPPW